MVSAKPRGRPRKAIDADLLRAAADEFLAKGYEAANIDSIVAAAAATKPALYRRYAGKQALFEAALQYLAKDFEIDLAYLLDDQRPPEEVLLEVAFLFFRHQNSPKVLAMARLTVAEGARFPALPYTVREVIMRGYLVHLMGYFDRLNREAVVEMPDTEGAAVIFTTLTGGIFERLLGVTLKSDQVRAHLAELVRFFLAGYGRVQAPRRISLSADAPRGM